MSDISKEEMQELLSNQRKIIEQNETLARENTELRGLLDPNGKGNMRILRKVTERKVTVRMIDGKAVIGYKNQGSETRPQYIYEKPDPKDPTNKIQYVDLILEGGNGVAGVNFKEFKTESNRVECLVKNVMEKEWILNQGVVKKREVEEYSSIELDFDVPLDVTGVTRMYTVEVPREFGGPRQVTVHESFVNIA